MQSPNDELTATIQKQIEDLTKIDYVLAADDFSQYITRYNQFRSEFPSRGYRNGSQAPWDLLFDNFEFKFNHWDPRALIFTRHYQYVHFQATSPIFYYLLTHTFESIHSARHPRVPECAQLRELIASQITRLRQRLAPRPPAEPNQNPAPITVTQPSAPVRHSATVLTSPSPSRSRFSQNQTLVIAGSTLMGISLLLHLNPSFGLFIGLHLSPPLFVLSFVLGGAMAIYGISRKESAPLLDTDQVRTTSMSFLGGHQIEQCLKFCFRFGRSSSRVPAATVEHSNIAPIPSVQSIELA